MVGDGLWRGAEPRARTPAPKQAGRSGGPPARPPAPASAALTAPRHPRPQLSALRLFHRVLGDPSLRGVPEAKELLLLATRVTRGLFARMVPPAPAAPKPATSGGGGADEAASAAARTTEEKEERIRSAVASMMFVEVLFWSGYREAEQMREDYHLRDE
jgi:hypothetical protein